MSRPSIRKTVGTDLDRHPTHAVERHGIATVQLAVAELGFLFREQPTDDYGIDAHVETTKDGQVLGHLLAIQVKAGESYFRAEDQNGWWFRPTATHVRYWLDHSLPVLVVLVNPTSGVCYWEQVRESTLVPVGDNSWKMLVPSSQTLTGGSAAQLRSIAKNDLESVRMGGLELARPWMRMLDEGRRLVLDVEEWVNKTSGRGTVVIAEDREDGTAPAPIVRWDVFLGLRSYAEALVELFPWAELINHPETYENAEWEDSDLFAELARFGDVHPYSGAAGEVEFWRLELVLNELGRSFLTVDSYVHRSSKQRLGPIPSAGKANEA